MSKYNNDSITFIKEFRSHIHDFKTHFDVSVFSVKPKITLFEKALYEKNGLSINDNFQNPFLIKSKYSVQEYYIMKNLGFDIFYITMAIDLLKNIYMKFELLDIEFAKPFEFVGDNNLSVTSIADSIWSRHKVNYYVQSICIGPYLNESSIGLQYFIDVLPDGSFVPKAKISVPTHNGYSFNVIIDNNTNYENLEKIFKDSALIDFKVVIQETFKDDVNVSKLTYETALQYLDLIRMQNI